MGLRTSAANIQAVSRASSILDDGCIAGRTGFVGSSGLPTRALGCKGLARCYAAFFRRAAVSFVLGVTRYGCRVLK